MFGHHVLRREKRLPAPPPEVFPFFAEARNSEAITPPRLRFGIVPPGPGEMRLGTLPLRPLGEVAHRLFVARDLATILDFRTERLRTAFTRR